MTRIAVAVLSLALVAAPAAAQQNDNTGAPPAPDLRQAAKEIRFATAEPTRGTETATPAPKRAPRMGGVERGVLTGLAGFGGFFAGGYIGAAIEGPCDCDDPGFMGAIIGAPIGAAAAAIVTWILTGRD